MGASVTRFCFQKEKQSPILVHRRCERGWGRYIAISLRNVICIRTLMDYDTVRSDLEEDRRRIKRIAQ